MWMSYARARRNGGITQVTIRAVVLSAAFAPVFPAYGDTLAAVSSAGLRDDVPRDGVADSIGSVLWVYHNSSATTVAVMEYNVSAFSGQALSVATVQGQLFANNSVDVGLRTFLVKIYGGNGEAELGDYAIAATEVGQFSYAPPADSNVAFSVDMLDAAATLIGAGATYLGVRIEPAGPDAPNVLSSAPTITLQTDEPAGPKAMAWTVEPASFAQGGAGVDGTEFTPAVPITVTAVGYYDDTFASGPGLSAAHDVGIYNASTFALVVSATVPAGDQVTLVDEFRMIDVTPTDLVAGQTYVLAAVSEGDYGRVAAPESLTVDARISMGAWRAGAGPSLSFPGSVLPTENIFLGPTFLLTGDLPGDSDGDGVIDEVDECPGTVPGATVDGVGCPPPIKGDLDGDGDVDLDDYAVFAECLSGANVPADPDCGT